MANYNVDIAVAVKNTQAITQLSNKINETGTRVDRLNEILEKFGDNIGGTVANSVKNFSNATKEAALNLNKATLGSREATRAAREFVRAIDLENAALREQAALIAQVRNQGKSGTLRGGTQFSGPIGPGPASSTALSSPLPARSTRTTQHLSPIGPISPQERTGRAEQIAREAALRSAANTKDFEARKTFQTELFNIEKRFENSLEQQRREADSAEFDRLLKRLNAEQNKIKEIGDLRAKINQKEIEDFDKRFKQARDLRGQTSPIGGAVGIPGSPAAKAAAAKKGGGNELSNLALGVGFPLLFGGGVGSVAGGALGSVGGMGGQVLGSAIGGIVDQTVESIAELGQALNPFTADIKAVTSAAGESGTAFERLVVELEEVAGKEKALEVATAQLATIIGSEGVEALKEFGDASSDLSNELSKAFTALGAALAPLLADIARATTGAVERSRLLRRGSNDLIADPGIQQVRSDLSSRKIGELEAEDRIVKIVKEREAEQALAVSKEAQAVIDKKRNNLLDERVNILNKELSVTLSGTNLLEESAYQSRRQLIFAQTRLAVKEGEYKKEISILAVQKEKSALAKLDADRKAQQRREDERQAKEAEAALKKAAREEKQRFERAKRLEVSLNAESIKAIDISVESARVFQDEEAAIIRQLNLLERRKEFEADSIRLNTENLQLEDLRLSNLDNEYNKKQEILLQTLEQLRLTEQISALSAAAGFNVLGLANNTGPFQSTGMYAPDTGPVSFEAGIDLAPLIAYQVELDKILEKYPMIGEAASAAAGLITTGFESIIDGTKSAEEVFADFLNNIADMLMKTAQQMIAQYIAIAIAKMFAGMGSAAQASDFNLNGFGNLSPNAASGTGGFLFGANNPLKFADGGRPPVGRPSIVGERGPELFVPGASGTIIPNHAMGGVNVDTINITVENTGEQLTPAAQKQLAGQVQGIVLSTLANERRSGGML